jgi:hypothetical protein
MAKMTKSQAKKRLIEADNKIRRVWVESPAGFLTPAEQKTILEVHRKLVSILMKK